MTRKSGSVLGFKPPRLHPIATDLHIAPTSCVVFAGVNKEPTALRIRTCSDRLNAIAGEQFDCGLRKNPAGKLRLNRALPCELKP